MSTDVEEGMEYFNTVVVQPHRKLVTNQVLIVADRMNQTHCIIRSMSTAFDKDHLIGFRDEATMFDVDTKARREPLPMTSTSGTFEPVLHYTMVCKNSESKSSIFELKTY